MKIKEVITRAMSGSINWVQAAEILGMSDWTAGRSRVRWNERRMTASMTGRHGVRVQRECHWQKRDSTAGHFERTNGKNKRCTKPIRPLFQKLSASKSNEFRDKVEQ